MGSFVYAITCVNTQMIAGSKIMDTDEIFDAFEQELVWLIRQCGSMRAFAEKIGISQSTISAWLNRKRLPTYKHALIIEAFTEGRVSRSQVRPDIYPEGVIVDRQHLTMNGFQKAPFDNN